jgi:hypothetical protein
MTLRRLKTRAQAKLGHYEVYSRRMYGFDNDPFGELPLREKRRNFRSRIGVSRNNPWRKHV